MKTLRHGKNDIEDDARKLKSLSCPWIGIINTMKFNIQPKSIYRFNAIPTKMPI